MKKLFAILLCLTLLIGLTACVKEAGHVEVSNKYVDLEVVLDDGNAVIFVDTNNGVLYMWYKDLDQYGQTITPLYNADGTLKNIEDFN